MTNRRIFWAVKALGIAPQSTADYVECHGVQSVGITTSFNLEQVFELGQIAIYENIEDIPDVEVTAEKVLDGYPLLYHLATTGSTSDTLSGRSGRKSNFTLSIFDDTQDSASGTPQTQVEMSGMFVSAVSYTFPVDGSFTESLTAVGNNKTWRTAAFTFSGTLFDNTDEPLALTSGWGGVQRREDMIFDYNAVTLDSNSQANEAYSIVNFNAGNPAATVLPRQIEGISSSGTNDIDAEGNFSCSIQNISVSSDLGRTELNELGRRAPFFRFVEFPVEVTCEIEVLSKQGDLIDGTEEGALGGGANLQNETIKIGTREGTFINLGTKNKLSNISYGGGDTGGGQDTTTYSYTTFNDFTVSHPQDPG